MIIVNWCSMYKHFYCLRFKISINRILQKWFLNVHNGDFCSRYNRYCKTQYCVQVQYTSKYFLGCLRRMQLFMSLLFVEICV